jgi:hypothetical protein
MGMHVPRRMTETGGRDAAVKEFDNTILMKRRAERIKTDGKIEKDKTASPGAIGQETSTARN